MQQTDCRVANHVAKIDDSKVLRKYLVYPEGNRTQVICAILRLCSTGLKVRV